MSTDITPNRDGPDVQGFLDEIDAVVEAAANRDARLAEIDEQYLAVSEQLNDKIAGLNREINAVRHRLNVAGQVRDRKQRAVAAEFGEATYDPEPF